MSTKHTPTPWLTEPELNTEGTHEEDDWTIGVADKDENGETSFYALGQVQAWEFDADTTKANAAFIVRACNSHADLREACEKARGIIGLACQCDNDPSTGTCPACKASFSLDAALAKARGPE